MEQHVRKSLRSKDGPIQNQAHNPKVVSSNLTPQPIDEFREIAGKTWYTRWYTVTMSRTVLQ